MITHNTSYGILHRRVDERPTVYFTREKHQRHYLLERPAGATINRAGTVDTAVTTMSHFIETFNQDYGILTFSRRIECTLTLWTCSVYEVPLLHTYCIRNIPVMAGFHSFGLNPSFVSHGLNLSLSLSILVTTDVFFEYSTSSNNLALVWAKFRPQFWFGPQKSATVNTLEPWRTIFQPDKHSIPSQVLTCNNSLQIRQYLSKTFLWR